MKRLALFSALACAALAPAYAAQLTILAPKDKQVLQGTVKFQVRTVLDEQERFLTSPEMEIQDEYGKKVLTLTAQRDPATGLYSVDWDTTRLPGGEKTKDGLYFATVKYRTIQLGRAIDASEELTLGIRNSKVRPAFMDVVVEKVEDPEPKPATAGEEPELPSYDLTVTVLDSKRKPVPGVRISIKAEGLELDDDAEITDSDGEAIITVQAEEPGQAKLTLSTEGLPAAVRFLDFR
ncbi:MAG: Ig-like domain-containing protein [Armatimonadota bacterium]